MEDPRSLESEVRLVRVLLRRMLAAFRKDASGMNERALAMFKGAGMVAHLLQTEKDLQADRDELPEIIGRALDELGEGRGWICRGGNGRMPVG